MCLSVVVARVSGSVVGVARGSGSGSGSWSVVLLSRHHKERKPEKEGNGGIRRISFVNYSTSLTRSLVRFPPSHPPLLSVWLIFFCCPSHLHYLHCSHQVAFQERPDLRLHLALLEEVPGPLLHPT